MKSGSSTSKPSAAVSSPKRWTAVRSCAGRYLNSFCLCASSHAATPTYGIDAGVDHRQAALGLEGIDAVVRGRVRILLSLSEPLRARRRLRLLVLGAARRGSASSRRPARPAKSREPAAASTRKRPSRDISSSSLRRDAAVIMHVLEVDALEIGVAELAGRQRAHQLSVLHDADARPGLLGAEQVVRGHQHRDAVCAQLLQQVGELVRRLGVETRRRLVEQQRLRALGQRDGDADLLPHALRVGADAPVGGVALAGRHA